MKTDNRTPLRKAVDKLRAEGKIKNDKDLQDIFGLSKSTISAYLGGKPGKDFITKFEDYFKLSLKEFEEREADLPDLARYIIETHAMVRVLLTNSFKDGSLIDAQRVVNQLLKEEAKKK